MPQQPPRRVPIVILAGSDRRKGPIPPQAKGLHFIVGYKGAELTVGGSPLAGCLEERIRSSGAFGEIYLAGPRSVYEGIVRCPIIDTDGDVGRNIHAAMDHVLARHGEESPVALIACDILPEAKEIAELAADLLRQEPGDPHPDREPLPALALSMILAEGDLGASAWKPRYRIRRGPGTEPFPYLPGHLGLVRPRGLRLGFVYRLLRLAYSERNRDYSRRQRTILARIIGGLLWRDFVYLFRLQPPTLTYTVVRYGLGTFARWRKGALDLDGLALGFAAVLVRRKYFRRWGARCVRIATSSFLSFARDLDTQEELDELSRDWPKGP